LTKEKHLIEGRESTLKFADKRGGNMGGMVIAGGGFYRRAVGAIIDQHYNNMTSV